MTFILPGEDIEADELNALEHAVYSTWTPTMTDQSGGSPALGNATVTARYGKTGKFVHGLMNLGWGSTTNGGSGITYWATPVLHNSGWNSNMIGTAYILDSSGSLRRIAMVMLDAGNQRFYLVMYEGTIITAAAPWTWATSDSIRAVFSYEAA